MKSTQTVKTIPEAVKEYLEPLDWVYGGILESEIGFRTQHKASIIGRRLREAESGKTSVKDKNGNLIPCEKFLEKRKVPNPSGKGAPVIQYRLIKTSPPKVLEKYAREVITQPLFKSNLVVK